jgi:hypothetical protein
MDESDAFEREVDDNAKEALASKLAVILFMECEARIDNWSDKELMLRLALVSSLEEGRDELAVISLPFIKVDADDDMEVFVTMDVAMAAAAVVAVAAAAAATLRAALILFRLLQIDTPS